MLMEFSIVPLGKAAGLSEDVAKAVKIVMDSGLPYRLHPMGTVVEGDWEELMVLVKRCRDEIIKGHERVSISMKIDDRPGKPKDRITEKLRSVEKFMGAG